MKFTKYDRHNTMDTMQYAQHDTLNANKNMDINMNAN